MELLTKTQCRLHTCSSAYVLSLDETDLVQKEPFVMAGGDVLNVGDKFQSTDHGKGAAATHGISLADGWYQQYEGKVRALHETGKPATFVLFSAYEITTGVSAVAVFNDELGRNLYIGYVELSGRLYSCRGRSGLNVVPCKSVQRYQNSAKRPS